MPLLEHAIGHAWCLIGAQMVRVHAALAGAAPPRLSRDLDLLGDVHARADATAMIGSLLGSRDFTPVGPSLLGVVHRFERGAADDAIAIDVLAPDNVGARANLATYGSATTIAVPGGTFALQTAAAIPLELLCLDGTSESSIVRVPSLAGALGIKACAVGVSDAPDAQIEDLILLLSLLGDISELGNERDRRTVARLLQPVAARINARAERAGDDRSLDARGALAALLDGY